VSDYGTQELMGDKFKVVVGQIFDINTYPKKQLFYILEYFYFPIFLLFNIQCINKKKFSKLDV
jgi:hypothetical protein